MATVRKRGDNYQIRASAGYDITGKQIIKTMTWKPEKKMTDKQIEKEVKKQAVLFEERVKNGLVGDNQIKFAEYSRYVIDLKERTGLKHSTAERYKSLLQHTDKKIGHLKIGSITPKQLNDFYKYLLQDGMNKRTGGKLSNKTVLEYHRFISAVLAQAERELLVPFNIASKATPPKAEKKDVNYYQIDEIQAILQALDTAPAKYKLYTMVSAVTGCRRGEILGIKWNKIDFANNTVEISNNLLYSPDRGVYETTTKTGKSRTIKLPAEVVQLLKEYKKTFIQLKKDNGDRWSGGLTVGVVGSDKWIENDFVFTQDDGKPMHPDTVTRWMGKFSEKNKLHHMNPHAFRHTVASILISEGVDITTVSKQLGHEKVSTTTDIYAHLIEKASERATETLGNVLFSKNAI